MDFCGGCQEGIDCVDGFSLGCAEGDDSSPGVGDGLIDGKNSAFKADDQFVFEPLLIAPAPASVRHAFDSEAQFPQGNNAEEEIIFIGAGRPGCQAGIWVRLLPF